MSFTVYVIFQEKRLPCSLNSIQNRYHKIKIKKFYTVTVLDVDAPQNSRTSLKSCSVSIKNTSKQYLSNHPKLIP